VRREEERRRDRAKLKGSVGPTAVFREARNYAARPPRKRGVKIALRTLSPSSLSPPALRRVSRVILAGPTAIIEIDILLMARTIIHRPFIELFPDNYESITII